MTMGLSGGTTKRIPAPRIVASPEATAFIQRRGGQLFVRTVRHGRCDGAVTLLHASTGDPGPRATGCHRLIADGFVLLLDAPSSPRQLPDELHVVLGGLRHRRVLVYWDGQAHVL